MKVAQLAVGSCYENKAGDVVRKILTLSGDCLTFIIVAPKPRHYPDRRTTTTKREFAEWAARPAGKKEDAADRAVRLSVR